MKLKKMYQLQQKIITALGDDLVVALAIDNGKYFVSVSTHKSKLLSFKTTKVIQTCEVTEFDLTQDMNRVADELIKIYSTILLKKDEDVKDETE